MLGRLDLRLGIRVGEGEPEACELFEEFFALARIEPIVRTFPDQALGMGEHGARMAELARGRGPPGEHLRQRFRRGLQQRQKIACSAGKSSLRPAALVRRSMLDPLLGSMAPIGVHTSILHRLTSTFE